jgi:hypothetical protein
MSQRPTILGLVLVAVLALSALGASAASAFNFKGESNPTHVTAQASGVNAFHLANGNEVKCKKVSMADGVELKPEAGTIAAEPIYGECETGAGAKAEIDVNGCKIEFTASAKTSGNVTIACPAKTFLELTVFKGEVLECQVGIETGTPTTSTVDYAAGVFNGKADITITSKVSGIAYETIPASGTFCGAKSAAKYTGVTTMFGFSDAKHTTATGLSIV